MAFGIGLGLNALNFVADQSKATSIKSTWGASYLKRFKRFMFYLANIKGIDALPNRLLTDVSYAPSKDPIDNRSIYVHF